MRINHNIAALNTYSKLSSSNNMAAKSMEKLSSGQRINKAGDDAAGLAISEKMRGQIRGLDMASKNAQDAISLIQTAEGALNETHSLVQRMRELAVQAANDTNTDSDRLEIQKEINQLTSEVDRISTTTEFNTKKLLDTASKLSGDNAEDVKEIMKGLKSWWIKNSTDMITGNYGLTADGVDLDIDFVDNSSASYLAYVQGTTGGAGGTLNNLKLVVNLHYFDGIDVASNPDGKSGHLYLDTTIAHEMVHAVMNRTVNMSGLKSWFKEGTAEFIPGADSRIIADMGGTSEAAFTALKSGFTAVDLAPTSSAMYSVSYARIKYLDARIKDPAGGNDPDGIKAIMDYLSTNSGSTLDQAIGSLGIAAFSNEAEFVADFNANASLANSNFDLTNTDTGSIGGSDYGGAPLDEAAVVPEVGAPVTGTPQGSESIGNFNVLWEDLGNTVPEVYSFHIGSNEDQTLNFALQNMGSEALGISGVSLANVLANDGYTTARYVEGDGGKSSALDVSASGPAGSAIKIYDDAINKISSYRAKLGAVQNRLEHSIKNLSTSSENLTASESRIRDTDIAKEMMKFTKNNILTQAAQSMLSQANQQPQGVLQLLR